ncbi:hypothetical protein CDD80_4458 [Ophiocordyceps camponoti-rufipedis]|uniref:Zn(2)-C6 fungal-type domain-containing protein n=1 Tax=Ophiocordyceps camponoti-rufipedis TaxID=2004952 RepID=A0A2C5YNB3_9HYPO|nr:hypothetical protein CDD80_4458 [Ophiocordyceps camponoti-rufipedis]
MDDKKPRACEGCRALKVRCEPDGSECRRCVKAGRRCVVTTPSRKRQKKTDSRVSELERKIDALTASLQARRRRKMVKKKRGRRGEDEDVEEEEGYDEEEEEEDEDEDEVDVVDRGLLSMQLACQLLERYTGMMMPHLPAVVIQSGPEAASTLRTTKPTLFLALLTAASTQHPSLQGRLQGILMRALAHKIMVAGEKRLELVQALQVSVIWYWPPERMEELKFYQLDGGDDDGGGG